MYGRIKTQAVKSKTSEMRIGRWNILSWREIDKKIINKLEHRKQLAKLRKN